MENSKKILLTEDDPFIAEIYETYLKNAGFEVVLAEDGQKGIRQSKETRPDLILLDLLLPKADGFEVLGTLKSEPELKNIPVIIITNLADKESIEKASSLGAADYIIKVNISSKEIVQKVKDVLSAKQPTNIL
jgi:DNA-binding response OmpR family regulator